MAEEELDENSEGESIVREPEPAQSEDEPCNLDLVEQKENQTISQTMIEEDSNHHAEALA